MCQRKCLIKTFFSLKLLINSNLWNKIFKMETSLGISKEFFWTWFFWDTFFPRISWLFASSSFSHVFFWHNVDNSLGITSARLPVCLPACLSAYLSVCLSICLSTCLSVCLPGSISACLLACLSVCLMSAACFLDLFLKKLKFF